jgi:hypothetical protein
MAEEEKPKDREEIWKELNDEYQIQNLVKFADYNIQDKLQESAYQIVRFKEFFLKEKNTLDQLNALKEKTIGEQYDYYRFNFDKELKQQEIQAYYLPKDTKILKINSLIRRQQWRVDFFELCVDALTRQSWSMKSWLESNRIGL